MSALRFPLPAGTILKRSLTCTNWSKSKYSMANKAAKGASTLLESKRSKSIVPVFLSRTSRLALWRLGQEVNRCLIVCSIGCLVSQEQYRFGTGSSWRQSKLARFDSSNAVTTKPQQDEGGRK